MAEPLTAAEAAMLLAGVSMKSPIGKKLLALSQGEHVVISASNDRRTKAMFPLFEEARDAITALTTVQCRLHNIRLDLAERMDDVGIPARWLVKDAMPAAPLDDFMHGVQETSQRIKAGQRQVADAMQQAMEPHGAATPQKEKP